MSSTREVAFTGRADELRRLRFALEDPGRRLIVLRGPGGAGKTALAETALAQARADGALTGAGKYAEGAAQSPYEPILAALSEALGQALDALYEPAPVLADLRETLGAAAEVLRRAGLRGVAGGPGVAIGATGRREGAVLLTDAVLQLAGWLEGFGLPIVLLIDDWRRNAPESRALLKSLVEACAGLTLVLTERDDVAPHEIAGLPLACSLEVGGLRPADRQALLEGLLGEAGAAAHRFLGPEGPDLPFDVQAAALALQEAGALVETAEGWTVDPARLSAADPGPVPAAGPGSVGLTPEAEQVGLALAVWGDAAPARWLRQGLGLAAKPFEAAVGRLQAAGLVRRRGDEIRFTHDRLREALLAAAGPDEARALAGRLADRLAACGDGDWAEVAYAALHLRQTGGVETADPETWRDRFAEGARAARERLDVAAASAFAECAWRLHQTAPARSPAARRLLLGEAVLAAADRRDPREALARAEALAAEASGDADLGEAHELAISALRSAGDPQIAWEFARRALNHYGLRIPSQVGLSHLLRAALAWRLSRRRPAREQAPGEGAAIEGLTRTAHAAGVLAFERSPALAVYITWKASSRVRRDARASAFWSSIDAFLSAVFGDLEGAAARGEQAIAQVREDSVFRASILYRAYYFGRIWVQPLAELRDVCAEIHRLSLLEGDLATAAISTRNSALIGWRTSPSLPQLRREMDELALEARRLGDANVTADVAAFGEAVDLMLRPAAPGEAPAAADLPAALQGSPLLMLEVSNFQGRWAATLETARRARAMRRGFDSHPGGVVWRFHEGLARLRTGGRLAAADLAFIRRAAALNPADHHSKLLILQAERLRAAGRMAASLAAYEPAVEAALTASSRLEAGLACEGAAEVARLARRPDLAERYEGFVAQVWRAWGAGARTGEGPDLERQLAEMQSKAAAAEREGRARARFLADVAHELRTPMQTMQGLIDLAATDPDALDVEAFRQIFGSLRTVVDDLTDFGAAASGEVRITLSAVDLGELARSEAAVAGPGRVEVQVAPDTPAQVRTDGARVRQVLRNLISNAVKYGGDGPVTVSVAPVGGGDEGPGEVALTVDDQGPGPSPADLRRIFEPFERGAHAGDGRGLGLGLALSRRMAEQLGGELRAESRPEGGGRFVLRLPAVPAESGAGEGVRPVPSLRVLLAEDVAAVRQVIARNLIRAGYRVEAAEDGEAAWRLARAQRFDVALVDWSMPGLDGAGLLARIAGLARRPQIVVLTASSDPGLEAQARAAGAAQVLRKPVSAGELLQTLASLAGAAEPATVDDQAFEAGMAQLARTARLQARARGQALVAAWEAGQGLDAKEVHRLAGLAAQFGWSDLARAADALELGLGRKPHDVAQEVEALHRALREGVRPRPGSADSRSPGR